MAKDWPTEQAKRHLEHLARQREISLHWTEKPPHASSKHKIVFVNPPTTGRRYLFGLHELGHVASILARDWESRLLPPASHFNDEHGPDYAELICESFAWSWAAEMADVSLVDLISVSEMRQVVTSGWGSYLIHCLNLNSG